MDVQILKQYRLPRSPRQNGEVTVKPLPFKRGEDVRIRGVYHKIKGRSKSVEKVTTHWVLINITTSAEIELSTNEIVEALAEMRAEKTHFSQFMPTKDVIRTDLGQAKFAMGCWPKRRNGK